MSYYLAMLDDASRYAILAHRTPTTMRVVDFAEVVALLNNPPQTTTPSAVVWHKPYEPGRVDGKPYMVWCGGDFPCYLYWDDGAWTGGWSEREILAWAEVPAVPSWITPAAVPEKAVGGA